MSSKATFLRVGVLMLAGLAAIIGLMLFFSRDQVRDGRKFESYFQDSVEGLDVGAPVKFRGVSLGHVTQIGLVSVLYPTEVPVQPKSVASQQSLQLVVVRYTIDPAKSGTVPDPSRYSELGLRARVASQGITGISYIELDFVNAALFPVASVAWTPRDDVVPSMPSTITQVQDAGQAVLAKLQALDLQTLIETAQLVMDDLDGQILAADVPGLSDELKATSASIRQLIDGKPTQELLSSAHEDVAKLAKLIEQLQRTATRADDGLADLQQRLDPLLRDAANFTANLRETSQSLRSDPAALLLGGPPPRGTPAR